MPEDRCCRRCGEPIPRDAPRGTCPACLIRDAMGGGTSGPGPLGESGGRAIPWAAGPVSRAVEPTDPGVGRSAGADTLTILSQAHGAMPRVLLRDPLEGPETPVPVPPTAGATGLQPSSSRYQFFGEIARGGMGAILKGHDAELNRDLAFKVLLDRHRENSELVRRFVEEAQIGGQLQHPGIVPIYELGILPDRRPVLRHEAGQGSHARRDPG